MELGSHGRRWKPPMKLQQGRNPSEIGFDILRHENLGFEAESNMEVLRGIYRASSWSRGHEKSAPRRFC